MADDELVELIRKALTARGGNSQTVADALRANPDVVMRGLGAQLLRDGLLRRNFWSLKAGK